MYMLMFIAGAAVSGVIGWMKLRRAEAMRSAQITGIYYGYGAPDAGGRVGWYRDNRHGSPYTDPDSKWGEAGSSS